MIDLFIADDHPIVLQGIRQMISTCDDIRVVGEARSGAELLDKIKKYHCDVLLMDIKMPDRNGLDLLQQVKHDYPDLRVLVLSMYPEEQYGPRYIRAGASGYLNKEVMPRELIKAVRRVASWEKYLTPKLIDIMLTELEVEHPDAPHETLSDREFDVFCKIIAGRQINEIAKEMCIGVTTVRTYKSRLLQKMGLKHIAELIHYAINHKLDE
ncbi:MAG: DNA-binding response regulator [Candidatus Marinimicrobia bacterium CG08_land_8_20_14_0_20_45_22]|nr:MAG: DNA-binding response regulator [Candidatus Marinimicrobia bacterium CG08_land_8_20_14_0_20_45_22]